MSLKKNRNNGETYSYNQKKIAYVNKTDKEEIRSTEFNARNAY